MKDVMQKLLTIARSRKARIAFNVLSAAIATLICLLLVQHFRTEGWPLAGAKVNGVIAAAVLFLVGYALKALGWRRLVRPGRAARLDGARRSRRAPRPSPVSRFPAVSTSSCGSQSCAAIQARAPVSAASASRSCSSG